MIPTYPTIFRTNLFNNYLLIDVVAILIYDPLLGVTDSPSAAELTARRAYTVTDAVANEIGGVALNSYERSIVTIDPLVEDIPLQTTEVTITATFAPSSGNTYDDATHIVYIRNANVIGATPANGNNRGDIQGDIIKLEPLVGAPVTLSNPTVLTHITTIKLDI